MRKAQKQEVLDCVGSLHQAHEEIREAIYKNEYGLVQNMLSECQEFAAALGESIERAEGKGHITVSQVEAYCETLFRVFEEIDNQQISKNRICRILRKQLLCVENSIKNDISIKKEIVFFPYKAAMWDSLESVYLAAKEDPDCDVYCVPIPYFTLNSDHSFGQMHYEGGEYPQNIEITDWNSYHFEERKPDVIYIHNPYDDWNLVTSVHPRYYSANLKKYTDTLVYIPYYSTSGGMNEAQKLCSAYLYADYIVIQAPKFREYFDESIPDKKFLPFGSPKFDRIIKKCQNPPDPPAEWAEKMKEKRVYFYNTSISGMLANTQNFLSKMYYVFQCFEGREDVCLLWRPHPLLESTFDSMRPQYRSIYDALKRMFLDNGLGILDTSSDMADAIALSDAYIGDAGTSVTSLFGIVGKPLFILNNGIHSEPDENSWRGEINIGFNYLEKDRFVVTQGNKLYISEAYQYNYKYFCDLSEHAYETTFSYVYEINGKKYVCPANGQSILIIGEKGIEKSIRLEHKTEKEQAFGLVWKYNHYLILLPIYYPAIVRYDTVTGKIRYFEENIDIFDKKDKGIGGLCIYQDVLYIASPTDNMMYQLHIESGETQIKELPIQSRCGCCLLFEYKNEMWLLPNAGKIIVRWNPLTGETREYSDFPEGFLCIDPIHGCECDEKPFSVPEFYGDYIYLTPHYANMYLRLNMKTGEFTQWQPSFEIEEGKEYFYKSARSTFLWHESEKVGSAFKIYSYARRKLYNIDLETNICKEIEVQFDLEELKKHESGFCEYSNKLRYVCLENSFNSLGNFLAGKIEGSQFDKERQSAAYREVIANPNGGCGKKIHDFITKWN